jgi:hypothetical protein
MAILTVHDKVGHDPEGQPYERTSFHFNEDLGAGFTPPFPPTHLRRGCQRGRVK